MKRDYDEVLSEYGIAAYNENTSNDKPAMTEREKFEKWLNTLDKQTLVTMTAKQARTIEELQAVTKAAVPEGFKVVPVEPTTEQYGGLARDIIQWMRFTPSGDQHSQSLIEWLKSMGNEIPSWLMGENEINHLSKHVLSKGTIVAIIYKAMLEAAPKGGGSDEYA